MKQHITIEQLNELSDKGKDRLEKWWEPQVGDLFAWHDGYEIEDGMNWNVEPVINYDEKSQQFGDEEAWYQRKNEVCPLLSIGQMIEFLDIKVIYLENEAGWWGIKTVEIMKDIEPVPELCDALWKVVKEILEK